MPGDSLEREADAAADRVMRDAQPQDIRPAHRMLQPKCASCENEEDPAVQRNAFPGAADTLDPEAALQAVASGGAPLADDLRTYFEPRFGRDFSHVRIHADGVAASAAQSVAARAYTIGNDIVFGGGEYAPATTSGKRLIAHELAHVIQQEGGHAAGVQRKLKVDAKASDDPSTAIGTIQPLVDALCPDFTIAASGTVTPKAGSDCAGFKFKKLAGGKQKVGCCCMCTLTAAPDTWTIIVTTKDAPTTSQARRLVAMTPTSGPTAPELRYWTDAKPTEKVQALPFTEAFGHELCGHAALMQIKAHPPGLPTTPDRAFSDVHDPTVRVENALATEMGLAGDRRGLADAGVHRGESLRVFTVGPYGVDADDPAPFAAQVKAAVDFLNGNERLMVDTVGMRDKSDTKTAVSKTRADKVEAELKTGVSKATVEVTTTAAGPETLDRVQPATDGGAGASAIVELRMAVRPAGLIKPIGAAPPAKPVHVDPEFPNVVKLLKAGGTGINPCHKVLADAAWP